MESMILIFGGIMGITIARRAITDPDYAREYATNNLKAYIWRKMFGVDKTERLIRKFFAPTGFIFSSLALLLGILSLFFK